MMKQSMLRTALHGLLVLTLCANGNVYAQGSTTPSGEWVDVAALEKRVTGLEPIEQTLDRESLALLNAVEKTMRRDLNDKQQELLQKADEWTRDIDSVRTTELNAGIDEALEIARRNRLNVPRLKRIYELTRKIVLRGDFQVAAARARGDSQTQKERKLEAHFPVMRSVILDLRSLDALMQENLEAYFDSLISLTSTTDEALASADRQDYKVRLYKRAAVAFLNALIASEKPLPECRRHSGMMETVKIGDQTVPLVGCPDPVVDRLRDYLEAIRTIQSADADTAAAEAEILIAEQQLAADLIAGVPVVGEVLDLYSVYAGENIAGRRLSEAERGFVGLMVVLPHAGVDPGAILMQGARRVPGFNATATALHDALTYIVKAARDSSLGTATQKAYQFAAESIALSWKVSLDELDDLLVTLKIPLDRDTRFLNRAMAEAAHGRKLIDDLPMAVRLHARARSRQILDETLESMKLPAGTSGMLDEHMDAYLAVAGRHDEIYLIRPVNEETAFWIANGYKTKPMPVKAKSAADGPFAALLPTDSELSKIGSKLQKARKAANPDPAVIARLEKELQKNQDVIEKCLREGCALEVDFELPTRAFGSEQKLKVHQFEAPAGGGTGYGVEHNGRWYDADALKQGEVRELGFAPTRTKSVKVLAAPDGTPYTADYDFLSFSQQRQNATPAFNENTGFIPEPMNARLNELEQVTADASRKARGVPTQRTSHHGPEQYFRGTPGADYPITVLDGVRNRKFVIPECDADCMRQWCSTTSRCNPANICGELLIDGCIKIDPDRLLKDYFHDVRLNGHSLDPNPNWGWGEYNALSGWTHPEVHESYRWPAIPVDSRPARLTARKVLFGDSDNETGRDHE